MPATARRRSTRSRSSAAAKSPRRNASARMVYSFGPGRCDGDGSMRLLLGGKGANLADMTSIGLPVPPGFTITTECCASYERSGGKMPAGLMKEVREAIANLERETGKRFGSSANPLLVSVRSGAAASMPGMMDTILNLGLNDSAVVGLAKLTGNERFAWDSYRRLVNMFGDVVMGVHHDHFEEAFAKVKSHYGVVADTEVPAEGLRELCDEYKRVYRHHVGEAFPQDPLRQLELAIEAVFRSWNKPTAISYRTINRIVGLIGTAVNVQSMVFGNMGDDSGTGVAFTRDPSTGENRFYGEFLVNAQGEDVVAGIRTPRPLAEMDRWNPKVTRQLERIRRTLERHYRDMQDIEFTVERGRLFMLQTRNGKRTGAAAVRIAVEMAKERLIDRRTALRRVPAGDIVQMLLPSFDAKAKRRSEVLARGLPASPGAACGRLAFSAPEAVERTLKGESVLLVRKETSPEDVEGMHHAAGILTSTGGMTSHAAVVARGWGKCCVAGAGALSIDPVKGVVRIGERVLGRADTLSIDGSTGEVLLGEVARIVPSSVPAGLSTILEWADEAARLKVRTNADTPEDAARARAFGAVGIGLCRTEHMFFEGERIAAMREMILADSPREREKALAKLLPYQRKDFIGIFTAMKGCPVTVRLLDPPLHEFVPHDEAAQRDLAARTGVGIEEILRRISMLHELNPMLGHRGCRLAVTYPEILRMQVRAITEAAIACRSKRIDACPEIMIPLVGTRAELASLRALTLEVIEEVRQAKRFKGRLEIPVGTMIEIPRAALTAGEVAEVADFFSFGTNDLTQMAFGFSRDDVNSFLPAYLDQKLLPHDPFQTIDEAGVGQLVSIACREGRAARKDLKLGICGEHGGDPESIRFFHAVGLDYVSCSPFRVPVARLVAAQVNLG